MKRGHLPVPPDYARDVYENQLKKLNVTRVIWESSTVRQEAADEAMFCGRKVVIHCQTGFHPAYFNVVFGKIPDAPTDQYLNSWHEDVKRWEANHQKPLLHYLQARQTQPPSGCRPYEEMLKTPIPLSHVLIKRIIDREIDKHSKLQSQQQTSQQDTTKDAPLSAERRAPMAVPELQQGARKVLSEARDFITEAHRSPDKMAPVTTKVTEEAISVHMETDSVTATQDLLSSVDSIMTTQPTDPRLEGLTQTSTADMPPPLSARRQHLMDTMNRRKAAPTTSRRSSSSSASSQHSTIPEKATSAAESQSSAPEAAEKSSAKQRAAQTKREAAQKKKDERAKLAEEKKQAKLLKKRQKAAEVSERRRLAFELATKNADSAHSRDSSATTPMYDMALADASGPSRATHAAATVTRGGPRIKHCARSKSLEHPVVTKVICKNVVPPLPIHATPVLPPRKPISLLAPTDPGQAVPTDTSAELKRQIIAVIIPDTPPEAVQPTRPRVEDVFTEVPETPALPLDTSVDDNNNNSETAAKTPTSEGVLLDNLWEQDLSQGTTYVFPPADLSYPTEEVPQAPLAAEEHILLLSSTDEEDDEDSASYTDYDTSSSITRTRTDTSTSLAEEVALAPTLPGIATLLQALDAEAPGAVVVTNYRMDVEGVLHADVSLANTSDVTLPPLGGEYVNQYSPISPPPRAQSSPPPGPPSHPLQLRAATEPSGPSQVTASHSAEPADRFAAHANERTAASSTASSDEQ